MKGKIFINSEITTGIFKRIARLAGTTRLLILIIPVVNRSILAYNLAVVVVNALVS